MKFVKYTTIVAFFMLSNALYTIFLFDSCLDTKADSPEYFELTAIPHALSAICATTYLIKYLVRSPYHDILRQLRHRYEQNW